MAPTVQKAVVIQQDGSVALGEVAVHKPGPDEILVRVVAAAQNPADQKSAFYRKRAGAVAGCDFSGVVEEIGSNVPQGLRSIGERVAGLVFGSYSGVGPQHPGSFAEYLVTSADLVIHVPDNWSFEDAGQLGIAPFTALMALYDLLEFPEPHSIPVPPPALGTAPIPILISGGASSVGLYTIQIAKHSGLYIIATASERNFDLVRSFGADVVVDYHDPAKATKQIREAAPSPIEHVLDCVSTGTSFEICTGSLDGKGTIANLTLGYPTVEGVKVLSGIVFDYFGKDYDFPRPFTASPEITAKGRRWARLLSEMLVKINLRPNPVLIMPRGLADVAHGYQYMSEGKVSAEKITYRIADTVKE